MPGIGEFVRSDFAWGPRKGTELTPEGLCVGARPRYRILKIGDGRLALFDPPDHVAGADASFVLVNDHTFTVNDGDQNFTGTYSFTFRIHGDRLTIHLVGKDEWAGTAFEVAPFIRVS